MYKYYETGSPHHVRTKSDDKKKKKLICQQTRPFLIRTDRWRPAATMLVEICKIRLIDLEMCYDRSRRSSVFVDFLFVDFWWHYNFKRSEDWIGVNSSPRYWRNTFSFGSVETLCSRYRYLVVERLEWTLFWNKQVCRLRVGGWTMVWYFTSGTNRDVVFPQRA